MRPRHVVAVFAVVVLALGEADIMRTGSTASAASDGARKGAFTPQCAERDLRAFAALEEFGQLEGMPSAWLADAGLDYLQARIHCLSGAEREGVTLYDRIIAGDARTANERRVK